MEVSNEKPKEKPKQGGILPVDIGTIIGIVLGIVCIIVSILLSGKLKGFYDLPSIFIVFGGSLASLLISFRLHEIFKILKVTLKAFFGKEEPPGEAVRTIVKLANIARREGLLALEMEKDGIQDEFLRQTLELVVDSFDPEIVRDTAEIELESLKSRHERGQSMYKFLGTIFPAWGMIGTLIGLVILLGKLDDPSNIGPAMAVALVTTFYGSVMANFVCIPIANKLSLKSDEEINRKQMVLEGMLCIQAGENPRIIEHKLKAFLSPAHKIAYEKAETAQKAKESESVTG